MRSKSAEFSSYDSERVKLLCTCVCAYYSWVKTLNDVQLAIFGLCDIQSLMKLSPLRVSQCFRYHSVGEGCAFQKIYNLYAFYCISYKKIALNLKILRKMHIL